MRGLKQLGKQLIKYFDMKFASRSIKRILTVSFTVVSVFSTLFLGIAMYRWYVAEMEERAVNNSVQLLDQTAINVENYLRNMRRISDAMYYSVIKDTDLASQSLASEMSLIYEINKDNLVSIACFTNEGELVAAAPLSSRKEDVKVEEQAWFNSALNKMENLHFSTPHVEDIFDDTSFRYHWVVSLSRAVELTYGGETSLGVLLVDMNYSSIEELFNKVNANNSAGYVYLMDRNGEIIYHPNQQLIYSNLYAENNMSLVDFTDGSYEEVFQGEKRVVTLKTVSYTGWKIVCVSPNSAFQLSMSNARYIMIILIAISVLMMAFLNWLISSRIAKPLQRLNASVKEWEAGNMNPDIYIGGPDEVAHVGHSLQAAVTQLQRLMQEVVTKQEEKRKSELDALQGQINPHFLYNTLDAIVWMIEGEKYEGAVSMVTQLAKLFRISLSKGKTIISIEDEITHIKNYMNIQLVRYKNIFTVDYDIDNEILKYCTVKLILQPLLENAIYYGMDTMCDDGKITVKGYFKDDDIYIEIIDNGLGMPENVVNQLLTDKNNVRTKGSGVGLRNVHSRLQLRFGEKYGLEIESVLDEGTTVRVHLPKIPYSPEMVEKLENGKVVQGQEEWIDE